MNHYNSTMRTEFLKKKNWQSILLQMWVVKADDLKWCQTRSRLKFRIMVLNHGSVWGSGPSFRIKIPDQVSGSRFRIIVPDKDFGKALETSAFDLGSWFGIKVLDHGSGSRFRIKFPEQVSGSRFRFKVSDQYSEIYVCSTHDFLITGYLHGERKLQK